MDGPSIGGGTRALPVSSLTGSGRMEHEIRELINARREITTAEGEARREALAGADPASRGSGGARASEKPQPKLTARALEAPPRPELEGAPRPGREVPASVKALEHATRREVVVARISAESAAQVADQGDRRGEAEGAKATGPTASRPSTETSRTPAPGSPPPIPGRTPTLLVKAVGGVPSNTRPHIDLLF